MTGSTNKKGMLAQLSASVNGALSKLGGAEAAKEAKAEFRSLDPTRISLPGGAPSDDEATSVPLGMMLDESAKAIVDRTSQLKREADKLVARIGERLEGEVTLRTQFFRLLIALGWFGVAVWLYLGGLNAQAADLATLPNGIPVDHAMALSRTFFIVAAAGAGVAFGISALVNGFGRGDNRRIREQAETFGLAIADASRGFDQTLTKLRDSMDNRGDPADSVAELSRAHLTALEACAYFRDIAFLTHAEGDDARRLFKGFLARRPSAPPSRHSVFCKRCVHGDYVSLRRLVLLHAKAAV